MNKYIRLFFLPIMILAGIFTCTMCALINAPIALTHWWRERKLIPGDLKNNEKYVRSYHKELENNKSDA